MNRRGFLGLLAATPVAAVLAPDLVELLTPTRAIFLPPRGGWLPSVQRYTYQTHALGFAITEEVAEDTAYSGILTSAAFRAQVAKSLNQVFSEQYSKHSADWEEIFR